jgi:L-seryl-tRNA(Ser) seleniumtransferase
MYVALENFMSFDHDKEWKQWEKAISLIERAAASVSGVTTRVYVPTLGNITPTLEVKWDPAIIKMSTKDLQEKLRNGNPSIEVISQLENSINITVWVMKPGQEKIVARRLKEALSA